MLDNKGYDFVSASAGPDGIVYEQFGALHLFDLKSGVGRRRSTSRVTADFPATRPHYDKVGKQISGAAVSPTGARAVFEARGEILTVPGREGRRPQPDADDRRLRARPGLVARRQVDRLLLR